MPGPAITTAILIGLAVSLSVTTNTIINNNLNSYTSFEKLNIVAYCDSISTNGQRMWCIEIQVQNTGSGTSVIDGVFLNDQTIPSSPSPPTKGLASTDLPKSGESLSGGERYKFKILIHNQCGTFSPGTMVSVKIHTAAGANYIQTIQLS